MLPDGTPVIITQMVFCPYNSICCGDPDIDNEGNEIPLGECCNK